MHDSDSSVVQGTPQPQSARKDNLRGASALKARSARSVIFSPNNTSHPYSPAQRPSLSVHPRSALSRSKSGLQSPGLTPTKGILKRTNSDDIRLAKDVIEGTRVNGRSFKRAGPGSSLANGGDVPASSSPPSSSAGREPEIAMSSSPPPQSSSPSSAVVNDAPTILASINTHIQTLLSASTPTYPFDPTRRTANPTPSPSPQGYHFQTSASDVAEAYTALTTRFRSFFLNPEAAFDGPTIELHGPLRANASDLIRAFTRDLSRLFTQPDVGDENRASSPSMVDGESGGSSGADADRRVRRGFSDEEITMRREEVAAGHAVLKWLALVFHVPEIFESFSDADILSLLRILLKIPLSPQTPSATTPFFTVTSASKRTYAFSIYALTHLRLPNRILLPVANDIIEACRRATTLNFPTSSSKAGPVPGAESNSNIKAKVEGLGAIYNLLSRNSSIFLSYHKELMPILLRGLIDKTPSVRARASAALGAAIAGGRGWVAECEEALRAAVVLEGQKKGTGGGAVGKLEKERRKIERKKREDEVRKSRKVSEEDVALTVVNGLKKKVGSGKDEMRTVQAIVVQLKASLERESAQWAVATWAILITLLGRNVATHITDLLDFMNVARNTKNSRALTLLCRQAWDHVIHAFVSQSSRRLSATDPSVDPSSDLFSYNLDWCLTPKRTKLLVTFVTTAKDAPPSLVEVMDDSGSVVERRWKEREALTTPSGQKTEMLRISVKSLTSLVYALTGALLESATSPASISPLKAGQPQKAEPVGKAAKTAVPAITVTTTSSTGNVLVPATSSATTNGTPSSTNDAPTAEQVKLDHLTTLFDGVVQPLLTPILAIAALDDVKLLGWSLLTAIFVSSPTEPREPFKLDRLLCQPFLRGEIGSFSSPEMQSPTAAIRERALWDLAQSAARDAVEVEEVQSWPVEWTSSRFSISVVKMFEAAVRGMRGLSDVDQIEWIRSVEGVRVLPVELSNLWKGLLGALNSIKPEDNTRPSKNYLLGLLEVTRFINSMLMENPAAYLPPTLEFASNLELVRYGLVEHLLSVVISTLGKEALSTVIPLRDDTILGAGRNGQPSPACILITRLVGRKIPSAEDDSSARLAFAGLLEKLVDVGVQGELGLKLLGDLTTNLENLATDEGNDHLRLDLWRIVTRRWTLHWPKEADPSDVEMEEEDDLAPDASPAASFIPKSTTLDLLTDLLTDPFRRFPSAWATASAENVAVWRDLLETTIGRCKAKKMSGNIVVVESISASLTDFEVAESLSRPSLECLTAMTNVIRYPGVNFPTNNTNLALKLVMRDLPESFLILIADALGQAYRTVPTHPDQVGPLAELLKSCAGLLREIPIGFVPRAAELLAGPVGLWLEDAERVLSPDVHASGPMFLYETMLSLLASTALTREGHIYRVVQPTNVELRKLSPLLVRAASAPHSLRAVDAFEAFWNATFVGVRGLEYTAALKAILKGLRSEGVDVGKSLSQSQSQSQSASLLPDPFTLPYHVPSSPVETQPEDSRAVHDESYDGDRSSAATLAKSTFAPDSQPSGRRSTRVDYNESSDEEDHRPPQARSPSSGTKRRRSDQAHSPNKRRQTWSLDDDSDATDSPEAAADRPLPAIEEAEPQAAPTPRTLRRSNSSSSVLATAVSWLPRMFRSPARDKIGLPFDPDATVDMDEDDEGQEEAELPVSAESVPVTAAEQERARKKVKISLDEEDEEEEESQNAFPGDEVLKYDEEEIDVQEDEEKSVTGLSHMSPSSQGSSSVVRETPKSARRAHRQTERKRMFGTESLINQSISFAFPGETHKERVFSPDVHSDPSFPPGSASSGHGSLSLRAEPTILEDEPEPADDTAMTENLSPLAKRSLPRNTAVSALRYPHVAPPLAAPLPPAPAAPAVPAPAGMDSLMSFMQDHIDGNDWTPHELATHSAKLAGMLAEMQNQLAAKLHLS